MKYTRLNQIVPGQDIVAQPIYAKNLKTMLIPANVVVTSSILTSLRLNGYSAIYIVSDEEEIMFFDYETEMKLIETLRNVHMDKSLDPWSKDLTSGLKELEDILDEAIRKICMEDDSFVHTYMLRNKDNWLYYHSISVCILALCIAKNLGGFSLLELKNLGMAALLHDLGKGKTNEKPDEFGKRYDHPKIMYQLLKDRNYNIQTALAIWQHHELADGSGYPNHLTEDKIHRFAKVISVCDCYDNICCKKKNEIHGSAEAIEFLCGNKNYDSVIVNSLLRCIRPYPTGTRVLLSSGLEGIVKKNHKDSPLRPQITINGAIHDLKNDKDMLATTIIKEIY